MEIWSKCDICGRDIPVGELCYGLKKGNCICKDCCTGFENCTFTLAPAPTLTPPNEPLMLDELREMDGEPVWVVDTTINRQEWCYWKGGLAYSCEAHPEYYDPDEYGLWLAYRRPPEGEEDK